LQVGDSLWHHPRVSNLLEVRGLSVHIPVPPHVLRAVDGVSFDLARGETLGLVGESGSGKTTLGRAILQVVPVASGEIRFRGRDVHARDAEWQRSLRRGIQMVFQDPYSSLNPRMTVAQTLGEVLRFHHVEASANLPSEVARLMRLVGLPPSLAERLPRGLSGGQRQRVGLARALAVRPELLVLDEPVAALDVSIQAQILNLLADLRQELGVAMLFVAHDLSVVRHISDRVAVMYRGRIVEQGTRDEIFRRPAHPYTRALLAAVPRVGGGRRHRQVQPATDLAQPSDGCAFAPRCPSATELCRQSAPRQVALSATQVVACYLVTQPRAPEEEAAHG
jgi:oligopeptide/dipeptide ABC transporter ATP-binding protein